MEEFRLRAGRLRSEPDKKGAAQKKECVGQRKITQFDEWVKLAEADNWAVSGLPVGR